MNGRGKASLAADPGGRLGFPMRLRQVALLVPGYDAGIAFLTGLGFALVEDTPLSAAKRWVVMRPQGGGSDILVARAVGRQRAAIGRQFGGRVGLFLWTEDFDAGAARVTGAGGSFIEVPRDEAYGRVAKFRDPFGNLWDLIAANGRG